MKLANRPNVDQSSRDALEDIGLPVEASSITDGPGNCLVDKAALSPKGCEVSGRIRSR